MNGYIDWDFYKSYTPNTKLTKPVFDELVIRASAIIDGLTFSRIKRAGGLESLCPEAQEAVKMATAAQVQTLSVNGGVDTAAGSGAMQQVAVGKFSYTLAQTRGATYIGGVPVAELALIYLDPTGLAGRSVNAGLRRGL